MDIFNYIERARCWIKEQALLYGTSTVLDNLSILDILEQECLVYIIEKHGPNVIKVLHNSGINFNEMQQEFFLYLSEYAPDIFLNFKEVGVDFTNTVILADYALYEVITPYTVKPLQAAGLNFSVLKEDKIIDLVNEWGVDIINPLQEVGVKIDHLASRLSKIIEEQDIFQSFMHSPLCDIHNMNVEDSIYLRKKNRGRAKWGIL